MRSRLAPLLALACATLPSLAHATVVAPMDLPALVTAADQIAVGRVEATRARFTDGGDAIVTEVTLRVERALKGEGVRAGGLVTFLREGGEVGGLGMRVDGAARFTVGEDVLVFLEKRGAARFTVGMAQGKLHIETVAGQRVARRDLAGLAFTRAPAPVETRRPLDGLCDEIRKLARAGAR